MAMRPCYRDLEYRAILPMSICVGRRKQLIGINGLVLAIPRKTG
jgi:hypothetical protein